MSLLLANRAVQKVSGVVDASYKISINTALGVGTTFALPLPSGQTYNFTVNYGDGSGDKTVTVYNDIDATHDYGIAFSGQITITGKCGGWRFNNLGDKLKVTSVDNWGSVDFDFISGGFYGCTNLTTLPSGSITGTTASVTDITSLFQQNTSLTAIPSNLFDLMTSLTGIANTFVNCTSITSIPVDLFRYNISVTNFASCFFGCLSVTSIPNNLFYYNTIVTNYSSVFRNCRDMALPASIFNLSNLSIVTTFVNFMRAASTTYSNTGTIQDIWNYALTATSTDAFLNQIDLDNYADIPNNWKGL